MPPFIAEMDGPSMNMNGKGGFGPALGSAAFGTAGLAGYGMSTMNGGSQFYNQMEMTSMDQGMSGHLGTMRDDYNTYDSAMALNDDFLNNYYFNVSENIFYNAQRFSSFSIQSSYYVLRLYVWGYIIQLSKTDAIL